MKTNRLKLTSALLGALGLATSLLAQNVGQWDFDQSNLVQTAGATLGDLSYIDGPTGTTSNLTVFASTTNLMIPNIGGVPAQVMEFPGNSTADYGIGYYMPTPPANGGGGGVYCTQGGSIRNSTLCNNTSPGGQGGGILCDSGGATLQNCLLYGNTSADGGGLYSYQGVTVRNCTFAGNSNTTPDNGTGIYLGSGGTVQNCIIVGNLGGGTNIYNPAGGVIGYSCSPGLSGSGNITNNPLFVNAAANNYRLSAGSPCINAGNNAYAQGATDLDDNPRIIGGVVDMGAYESTSGSTANGIPWAWLLKYGLATDGSADHQQADADTFDNLQEYVADLNPTNAASFFAITAVSNLPPWTVYFESSAGRRYTLTGVSNLASGAWSPVPGAGPRPGTGGPDALSDTNVPPKGPFYKLRVELP